MTAPPDVKRPGAAGAANRADSEVKLDEATHSATNDRPQEVDFVSPQPLGITALVVSWLRDIAAHHGPENAWRDMIALLSGVLLHSLNSSGLEATLTLLEDADIVLRRTVVANAPNAPETLH